MSLPVDTRLIAKRITKAKIKSQFSNDELIKMAGGGDAAWGRYLAGPRAAAIISSVNAHLAQDNLHLLNYGNGQWRLLTDVAAHEVIAHRQLSKAPNHIKNAVKTIERLLQLPAITPKLKRECFAWLDLYRENESYGNMRIFEQWASELQQALPAPRTRKQS